MNYPLAGYYWVQYNNQEKSTFIARLSWSEDVGIWSVFGHDIEVPFDTLKIVEGPLTCSVVRPPPKDEVPTRQERVLKSFEPIPPLDHERAPDDPATLEEILTCFTGHGGTVTVNAVDFCAIRNAPAGRFQPITTRDLLMTGWVAILDKVLSIYVSRRIPVGYYCWGHHPELHTKYVDGMGIQPHLDSQSIRQVQRGLEPFKLPQPLEP
jgi:hypothetical protein